MSKITDLINANPQEQLDALIAKYGLGEYVESVTYLAHDAQPPVGAFVIGIRDAAGDKVEVAITLKSAMVGIVASALLKVL